MTFFGIWFHLFFTIIAAGFLFFVSVFYSFYASHRTATWAGRYPLGTGLGLADGVAFFLSLYQRFFCFVQIGVGRG